MEEEEKHPNPERWWRVRRGGFYFGRNWAVVQTFIWIALGLYDVTVMEKASTIAGWSYGVCIILIIGYYSNTALEEFSKKIR
jgi:hypothetical protein